MSRNMIPDLKIGQKTPDCSGERCPQWQEGCKLDPNRHIEKGDVCRPLVERALTSVSLRTGGQDVDWSQLSMADLRENKGDVMWWLRTVLSQSAVDELVLDVFRSGYGQGGGSKWARRIEAGQKRRAPAEKGDQC